MVVGDFLHDISENQGWRKMCHQYRRRKKRFCSDTFGHHTDDERNRMDSDDDNYMG